MSEGKPSWLEPKEEKGVRQKVIYDERKICPNCGTLLEFRVVKRILRSAVAAETEIVGTVSKSHQATMEEVSQDEQES